LIVPKAIFSKRLLNYVVAAPNQKVLLIQALEQRLRTRVPSLPEILIAPKEDRNSEKKKP